MLLLQNLVLAGFLTLKPTLSDGGPFQDPDFVIPAPLGDGKFLSIPISHLSLLLTNFFTLVFVFAECRESAPAPYSQFYTS